MKNHCKACLYASGMNPSSPALPGCFRRALAQDAPALATLAFRSKALWGYDPEFLERARPALTPSAAYLAHRPVYLLEAAGHLIGFYGFDFEQEEAFLQHLFLARSSWAGATAGACGRTCSAPPGGRASRAF